MAIPTTDFVTTDEMRALIALTDFLNDSKDNEMLSVGVNVQVYDSNGEVLGYVYADSSHYVFSTKKPEGLR